MVCTLHDLHQELEQLSQWRELLAGQLLNAADGLDSPGQLPSDELIDDLVSYRERMLRLTDAITGGTTTTNRDPVADITLVELKHLFTIRNRREQIIPVMDEILKCRHAEACDFAPLAMCHAEAKRLRELATHSDGSEADAELDAVCQQTHPLNLLLKLCEQGDRLSDSDWIECNDRVTAAYGRQLATALARGRILRTPDLAPTESSPRSLSKSEAVVSGKSSPNSSAIATTIASFDLPIVIEASRELRPTPPVKPRVEADSIFEPSPLADSVFEERTPPPKLRGLTLPTDEVSLIGQPGPAPLPVEKSVDSAARSNRAVDGSESRSRASQTTDLAVELLTEDRLPLAMHLTRCAELRSGPTASFPQSWLLRSLILGTHLSDSKGELARQIDDDLRNFRPEHLADGDADRQLACGYLMRAAALPAALFSGSTAASAILRAFRITPGCSQLYNYCSRIALYSDRLDGQIVEMFRPQSAEIDELDTASLGQVAAGWLQETARKATTYGRTSPLFLHAHWTLTASTSMRHSDATQTWCKWQETLLLVSRLLRPVCHNLEGERHWVRQEMARLSSHVRAETHSTGAVTSSRDTSPSSEEMHSALCHAIELASRWLRVSGAKSAQAGGPLSQDAFDLRDEVLERTAGVLGELNEQWQANSSPLVRAGIACCRRSVERIHSLFNGSRSLPLKEIDLRHALHAELLKIPGLELNDHWLPEADPETLERELCEHTTRGDTSWQHAYETHNQHGNHEATGRLLELDVWSSEAERDELRAKRNEQIAEHRKALTRELDEVSLDLEVATNSGQLEGTESEAIARRLDRLHHDLPKLLNFGSCRWQLDQIRSALQRCRSQPVAYATLAIPGSPPTNMEQRRTRMVLPSFSDQANEPPSHEMTALVTDIFSEE